MANVKGLPETDADEPDSEPSEQPPAGEPSSLTPFRTILVFAVILGCFAVIYPRFIHPVFKYPFGGVSTAKAKVEEKFLPPKFQTQRSGPPVQAARASAMHGRPTHHPGARFTNEYQAPETKGSLYFMLPIYTVGIIAFLLYTFYKVLSRTNQIVKPPPRAGNIRYDPAGQHFTSEPLVPSGRKQQAKEEPKITEEQLKYLEVKLAETEAQMNALIEQMTKMKSEELPEPEDAHLLETLEENDVSSESDEDIPSTDVNPEIAEKVRKAHAEEEEENVPVEVDNLLETPETPDKEFYTVMENPGGLKRRKLPRDR